MSYSTSYAATSHWKAYPTHIYTQYLCGKLSVMQKDAKIRAYANYFSDLSMRNELFLNYDVREN